MSEKREKPDGDGPLAYLYWRDEILQVMYWMTGEGFGQSFAPTDLKKFLDADDSVLAQSLERMVSDDLLEKSGDSRYALSALGREEGGRRFADEFLSMTRPGHFECDEPDCDCHDPESEGEACKHLSPAHSSQHVN